jgi:excisionase family DNA binding protein
MRFLTLFEVADILRVKPEAVRRRAKTGTLPATKPGKSWLFDPADVLAYVEQGANQPEPSKEPSDE